MRRKSALPETVGTTAAIAPKCWGCDSANPPAFLCPSCPKRGQQDVKPFNHGWRALWQNDRELAEAMIREARAARALATTREDHPAYADVDGEYVRSGIALARLRARRAGLPDPFSTEHDARGYLKSEYRGRSGSIPSGMMASPERKRSA